MEHNHHNHVEPLESPIEYLKFAGVIGFIIAFSILLTAWFGWAMEAFMANFMGVFFIVFAVFKMLDIKMFAMTYSMYDVIAKRFKAWAYAFPFVELALGILYLILQNNLALNVVTVIITGIAGYGVLKEIRRKSDFQCACLGAIIKLPLSKVSFVEDFAMMIMAAVMIFL